MDGRLSGLPLQDVVIRPRDDTSSLSPSTNRWTPTTQTSSWLVKKSSPGKNLPECKKSGIGWKFSSPHFAFVWGGKEVQSLDRPVEEEVQNNQFFSRVGYRQLQTKQLGPIASNSRFTLASPLLHSFWLCWEPSRSKAGSINCGRNLNCLIIGRESSFHYTVRVRGMAIDYNCLWNEIHLFLQLLSPWWAHVEVILRPP